VATGLVARGVQLPGADVYLESDVPIGGGLSSSASLEVATGLALLAGAGEVMAPYDLALLCQHAEHEFAGAPCGIMDQAIAVLGEAGHALLLDCRDGDVRQVPFDDPSVVVLVADTRVKHAISDGGYAARRDQCYAAAAKLEVGMLREATGSMVAAGDLTDVERKRARHVVGEIARTIQAVEATEDGDYGRFGELMFASHESLRDDYEVSCEELDAIVESARGAAGVFGARMTGGGFGGCAIVLAAADAAEVVAATIAEDFERRFGRRCPIFATRAAAGAGPAD
jgi:galactokinase